MSHSDTGKFLKCALRLQVKMTATIAETTTNAITGITTAKAIITMAGTEMYIKKPG